MLLNYSSMPNAAQAAADAVDSLSAQVHPYPDLHGLRIGGPPSRVELATTEKIQQEALQLPLHTPPAVTEAARSETGASE